MRWMVQVSSRFDPKPLCSEMMRRTRCEAPSSHPCIWEHRRVIGYKSARSNCKRLPTRRKISSRARPFRCLCQKNDCGSCPNHENTLALVHRRLEFLARQLECGADI